MFSTLGLYSAASLLRNDKYGDLEAALAHAAAAQLENFVIPSRGGRHFCIEEKYAVRSPSLKVL
jgi:hypothetical protein